MPIKFTSLDSRNAVWATVADSIARPLDTATSSEDSSLLHVDFSSED
jgi:hypothetical protein